MAAHNGSTVYINGETKQQTNQTNLSIDWLIDLFIDLLIYRPIDWPINN